MDDSFQLQLGNRSAWRLYGGTDHINAKTAPNEQSGIMLSMQQRMAAELSCFLSAQDFYRLPSERLFFADIDYQPSKADNRNAVYIPNEQAIRTTLVHLHLLMWHQEVNTDSAEIDMAYQLYQQVFASGKANARSVRLVVIYPINAEWITILIYIISLIITNDYIVMTLTSFEVGCYDGLFSCRLSI